MSICPPIESPSATDLVFELVCNCTWCHANPVLNPYCAGMIWSNHLRLLSSYNVLFHLCWHLIKKIQWYFLQQLSPLSFSQSMTMFPTWWFARWWPIHKSKQVFLLSWWMSNTPRFEFAQRDSPDDAYCRGKGYDIHPMMQNKWRRRGKFVYRYK